MFYREDARHDKKDLTKKEGNYIFNKETDRSVRVDYFNWFSIKELSKQWYFINSRYKSCSHGKSWNSTIPASFFNFATCPTFE